MMESFTQSLRFSRPLPHVTSSSAELEYRFTRDELTALEEQLFRRGKEQGEERIGQQVVNLRQQVGELQAGLFDSLRRAHTKIAAECEEALIELALGVAGKLVSGMPVDQPTVEAAIKEAVGQFDECATYEIQLHPADHKLVSEHAKEADWPFADSEKFKLCKSDEVTRGGCVVRAAFGSVDSRRETKLVLMKEALL
ncbi:MAG: flagellar assembly protein FliH [Limisphaerales bacterium]|jgi:flagellar assembly protein FliH